MGGLARENYELKNQVNMKLPDFNNCIVVRLNKYLYSWRNKYHGSVGQAKKDII